MWISLDMGTLPDIVPFLHAFACCCCMTLHKMTSNVIVLLSGGLEMKTYFLHEGAQWLSGRVLDMRPRGCRSELPWCHCVVSLSKIH